jgi:hypothetical protein
MATLRTRGEITAPPMHQNARQRLGTGLAVDSFIALGPLEADPERLKNDSVSRFKRLRSAVLRRCLAKASVRREVA